MEARRYPTSGPVDTVEWFANLCASASRMRRRQESQSSGHQQQRPNDDDDLDPGAISSGILDAFSILHDSLASLLGDPDTVREVVERGGELYRLDRGEVAEACRRRKEEEGHVYSHHGNCCDNANGNGDGHSSPGRRDETRRGPRGTPRPREGRAIRGGRTRRTAETFPTTPTPACRGPVQSLSLRMVRVLW